MTEQKYFAALNGGKGFLSFFDDIFSSLDRVYIIKGGPGTGKSKLMRDIAAEAVNKAYTVEYFYCSADPESLDGIIIKELNVGVLDGTAPHVADPVYPGSREDILNVGAFWKSDVLKKEQETIRRLTDEKAALYRSVYAFLSAAEQLENETLALLSAALLKDKMTAAVARLLKSLKKGSGFSTEVRLVEGFGMKGRVFFDSLLERKGKVFVLKDRCGVGSLFLKEIVSICRQKDQPVTVSYSPITTDRLNAVCLREAGLSFHLLPDGISLPEGTDTAFINLDRFLDNSILKEKRPSLRFCEKSAEALIKSAADRFEDIGRIHFDLEQIYIRAMDFHKKEAFTKKLLVSLFK